MTEIPSQQQQVLNSETAPPVKHKPFWDHYRYAPVAFIVDSIGAVSSVVMGSLTAKRRIEELAYKNVSSLHGFEDLKAERRPIGPSILNQVERGEIGSTKAYELMKQAIHAGEIKADTRLAQYGADTLWKQFNWLRGHQKGEVIISAVAVSGIALGAVLLTTRELFRKKDQANLKAELLALERSEHAKEHEISK
jgi:hypothetical protein